MSDKVTVFFCTLCSKTWDALPEGAVLTTTKRGGNGLRTMYRFADGTRNQKEDGAKHRGATMTQFTDDRLTQQRQALIQQRTKVFQRCLSKHPEHPYTIATLRAFKRYIDFTDLLKEDEFEFACGNMRG